MDFSVKPKKYSFSSLIPCYLLKVTKFLHKISQFEFLVMAEKNVFVYKPFSPLNISNLFCFLCKTCTHPLKKVTPSFPATPSKSWGFVKPPFLRIWLKVNPPPPPPAERGGGAHYEEVWLTFQLCFMCHILKQHGDSI